MYIVGLYIYCKKWYTDLPMSRDWVCLLCGTSWVFKSDRSSFVLNGLNKWGNTCITLTFQRGVRSSAITIRDPVVPMDTSDEKKKSEGLGNLFSPTSLQRRYNRTRMWKCLYERWPTMGWRLSMNVLLTLRVLMTYIYIYIYMSYRTANLQTLHFKYLLNKYTYWIF